MPDLVPFQPFRNPLFGFGRWKPVQEIRIDRGALIAEVANRLRAIWRLDNLLNRQLELVREFEVTLVMTGYSHDCPGAIAGENVVGNPDGDALLIDGIDRKRSGEDAGLLFREFGAFEIALRGCPRFIFGHGALLIRGCEATDQGMFGGEDHVSRAE